MRHEKTVSRITGDVKCSCGFFYCEEEDTPDHEDYRLHPTGYCGARTDVFQANRHVGTFSGDEDAFAAIRADMEAQQFWPDVWMISDHGNAHLIALED